MKRNALPCGDNYEATYSQLSKQDYVVLLALADRLGGERRLVDLGREPGWEKSGISHQVTRMADRRLATKSIYSADGEARSWRPPAWAVAIAGTPPNYMAAVRRLFVDHLSQDQLKQLMTDCERVLAVVGGPGDSCCLAEDESTWPRPRGYTAAPGRCRPGTVVFSCGIVSVAGTRGLVCGGMGGTYPNCWRPNLGWYGYEYIKKAGS